MFRKSKIEPVEKVKIVERYLEGEIGIRQAGKELGVDPHSIRNWISIYQYDGPTGLLNQPKNRSYSKDLKISAINDYLNGEGSLQDICTKYGIRSHRQLSDWIKVYNSGGILKTSTGGAYMKKAKNTTLDERLKIVTDCLANDKNYGAMALKYDCSYQQVRNWVIRYEKMGQAGLEDRRGRRIASLPSRTPEEVEVAFTLDATSLDGKQLVAFEELYDLSNPDEPKKVTEHKDIEDKGQTITFKEKPAVPEEPETPQTPENPSRPSDSPKTGDNTNLYGLLALLLTSGAGLAGIFFYKRRKMKKS